MSENKCELCGGDGGVHGMMVCRGCLLLGAEFKQLQAELDKARKFKDYSYYVGGEITCDRVPDKYSRWVENGCPA